MVRNKRAVGTFWILRLGHLIVCSVLNSVIAWTFWFVAQNVMLTRKIPKQMIPTLQESEISTSFYWAGQIGNGAKYQKKIISLTEKKNVQNNMRVVLNILPGILWWRNRRVGTFIWVTTAELWRHILYAQSWKFHTDFPFC